MDARYPHLAMWATNIPSASPTLPSSQQTLNRCQTVHLTLNFDRLHTMRRVRILIGDNILTRMNINTIKLFTAVLLGAAFLAFSCDQKTASVQNVNAPAVVQSQPAAIVPPVASDGAELYKTNCAACHGTSGEGGKKGIPLVSGHALHHTEADYVEQVKDGKDKKMPAFKDKLSPDEIDAVVKYVRNVVQAGIDRGVEHH